MNQIAEIKASTLSKTSLLLVYALSFGTAIGTIILMQSRFDIYASDIYDGLSGALIYFGYAILMAVVVTVLHEGMHGLFFKLMGGGKVVFGVKKIKWMGIAFYASSPNTMYSRAQFTAIGLAPQILTAVVFILAFTINVPSAVALGMMLFASMNFGGGCMDIYSVFKIWQLPKGSMIEDIQDGFRVYEGICH
jgi:hypothetical protein